MEYPLLYINPLKFRYARAHWVVYQISYNPFYECSTVTEVHHLSQVCFRNNVNKYYIKIKWESGQTENYGARPINQIKKEARPGTIFKLGLTPIFLQFFIGLIN